MIVFRQKKLNNVSIYLRIFIGDYNYILGMQNYEEIDRPPVEQFPNMVPSVPKPKKKRRKIVESPKSGSEESFEPEFNQYKKVGLPVDMKRVTTGSWALEENKVYLNFLQSYKKDFENEVSRRKSTVFNRLSKALRKRTPDQCRSHHQKLQNRFHNNIQAIIDFVKGKIAKQMLEGEDKTLKTYQSLKPTATGTLDFQEDEPLEIDLVEVMMW